MKRVLLLGGYGLIGLPILRRLIAEGISVTALARDVEKGRRLEPRAHWVKGNIGRMTNTAAWAGLVSDADIIINASGALQSGLKDNLEDLQYKAISALVDAAGVDPSSKRLFIQISAPGAEPDAPSEFLSTKARADLHLKRSGLDWVILKPALVISPMAYGGTALLRMLAAFPLVLPLVYNRSLVQTVDVEEVVEAVYLAMEGIILPGTDVEIAAAAPMTLEEVVLTFRRWLGLAAPLAVLSLPLLLAKAMGKCADGLGHLGWRSPLRSTALDVMAGGVLVDAKPYMALTGRSPRPLDEVLASIPSTVQERWYAHLFLLMPIVLGVLSLFWLASGIVALFETGPAAAHLIEAGLSPPLSKTVVVAGSLLDILLGLSVLVKPVARRALLGMVAVTLAYLIAGSVLSPLLWLDPLGPYVKTIPGMVLALVGFALVETR